jgi:ATP-dependent Clp protease ATP-binding subunit ClpC
VKITVPIYIQKLSPKGATPQMHILRPLFHPQIEARGEDLNRAMTKLAQKLRQVCDRLGRKLRHEELARYGFAPEIEDHFYKARLDLGSRMVKCNFLIVAFQSLGRRIAFTPSLPDLWFEIHRGETLADRTAEVLTHYFRDQEKRDGKDALKPETISVAGKAWVTTLEISINPPSLAQPPKQNLFARLGGGEKMHGAEELEKTGHCLNYLYPDDLSRAIFREAEVAELAAILQGADQRPVLVIGERLVGKTAIIHEFVYRLVAQPSRKKKKKSLSSMETIVSQLVEQLHAKYIAKNQVWLLSPQRLISGMSYVGQWENRLLAILKEARKRHHLLYFDDLLGLYQAGQSSSSSLSVADVLKPYVEKREVRILGEITPEAFRVLQERDRSFADSFQVLPVKESDEDKTFRILLHLMRQLERKHRCTFATEVFPTVMDVQRRYARDAAFPGKAAVFLQQLAVKFRNERVSRDDVLQQFHAKSGLSLTFLNDSTKLQRQEVTEAIGQEVIGQEAAIEACADVVTMAKARLNDTDRPLASFLFLGPTGVGKTQCAKSLASFLFGDAGKILRFDMNEYASAYAAARLVGAFNQPEGLLTSAVRRQPFAIVLLDEIEKAHPDVFNLLLQVMGDGRLTDALGRTVDFTNAILILTSNLGVREAAKSFGFRRDEARESHLYLQAAEKFFKPEFFNRLDRIVPFESLTREDVQRIAQGLIQNIFAREGLVRRKCVLQVDERAMNRIVEAGYDPQLGARALKRMLERQLTQPVAARLATLKPDAPTIINVYQANDKLAIAVDGLRGATANDDHAMLTELLDAPHLIARVEATMARIEESVLHLRPEGLINPSAVPAHHLAYFQIKEQAHHLRDLCRRLEPRINKAKNKLTSRSRGRSISATQFTLRQVEARNLWQRIVSATNIHRLLKELATEAQPHGEGLEDYLAELIREASLLETLAQANNDEASHRLVLLIRSLDESRKAERELLAKSYAALFEYKLGMKVKQIREVDGETSLHADALVIRGVNASLIANGEAGTHLFYTAQEGLAPIQVRVLPLPEEDEMAAIRKYADAPKQGVKDKDSEESTDEDLFQFLPVIRVYQADGVTLDLRSGLMTLKTPTAQELRALVLATLPLPGEFEESLN